MGKSWFKVKGNEGERTLEEQILAIKPAIAECAGKTVLDLGSAEGLISREFAKAGALSVLGIEREPEFIAVAVTVCHKWPVITFREMNLRDIDPKAVPDQFDIVLALGIIHKLDHPEIGMRFAARSARNLLLLRSGRGSINGIIRGKYSRNPCDSAAVLKAEGFALEKVVQGPPHLAEPTEYWRRIISEPNQRANADSALTTSTTGKE